MEKLAAAFGLLFVGLLVAGFVAAFSFWLVIVAVVVLLAAAASWIEFG